MDFLRKKKKNIPPPLLQSKLREPGRIAPLPLETLAAADVTPPRGLKRWNQTVKRWWDKDVT